MHEMGLSLNVLPLLSVAESCRPLKIDSRDLSFKNENKGAIRFVGRYVATRGNGRKNYSLADYKERRKKRE